MPAVDTFDVAASLAATGRQNAEGAIKVSEDIDRYLVAICTTRPNVLIECGTWQGGSARWFAQRVPLVISIDVDHSGVSDEVRSNPQILLITGSSTDPDVLARVADAAQSAGGPVMVVLDSDHRTEHVRREIEMYGPLVTPGYYLVVEDGIARWMEDRPYEGSPLDAIEELLVGSPDWRRDERTERMHPVSMHPAGWWVRRA